MSGPAPLLALASPSPLWRRAADRIVQSIDEGTLAEGDRLPPERDLGAMLDVSRVTVRKALLSLVEEGVLRSEHGRGWFVSHRSSRDWPNSLESFSETAARLGLVAGSIPAQVLTSAATLDEAEQFGIAPGSALHRVTRVRTLDGVPIALDIAVVPLAVAPGICAADWSTASLYEELDDADAIVRTADATIEARPADAAAAAALGIPVGAPVLAMEQRVSDESGRVLLISRIVYAGERYRLRTTFIRP